MGRIQHLCLMTGGTTPAGLASSITEGTYEVDTGATETLSIGDKRVVDMGVPTGKISFTAKGMLKAELLKYANHATGTVAATVVTPLLLISDTGEHWILSNGAGASVTIEAGADLNSIVGVKVEAQFGTVAAGAGTETPVYLTALGHLRKHASLDIDTSAPGTHTFSVSVTKTLEPNATLDPSRSAQIAGYNVTGVDYKLSTQISEAVETPTEFLAGTAGVYTPHDIVIALANGQAGENVTITCADYIAPVFKGSLQAEGVIYKDYEWQPGTGTIGARIVLS